MLAAPATRKMVITRLRRLAMMRGPAAVRTCEPASPKSMSRTQCSRSSMPQWPRMMAASWAGLAWVMVSGGAGQVRGAYSIESKGQSRSTHARTASWRTGSSAAQSARTQDWTEACRRPSGPGS